MTGQDCYTPDACHPSRHVHLSTAPPHALTDGAGHVLAVTGTNLLWTVSAALALIAIGLFLVGITRWKRSA